MSVATLNHGYVLVDDFTLNTVVVKSMDILRSLK